MALWLAGASADESARGRGLGARRKAHHYREIEEETGFNRRTLERWMRDLRRAGYIETKIAPAGIIVRITKAKKFPQFAQGGRKFEGGARRLAEPGPQNCVADGREMPFTEQQLTDRMGSSFIEESIEKQRKSEIHRDFHSTPKNQNQGQKSKPSWLDENQNPPKTYPPRHQTSQLTLAQHPTNPPGQQYSNFSSKRSGEGNCCEPNARKRCGESSPWGRDRSCSVHEEMRMKEALKLRRFKREVSQEE